jgi:signal transduction histidine kinase/ligand-binding sensor domain-containing protein
MTRYGILILLTCVLGWPLAAAALTFQRIDEGDGLPRTSVTSLLQDREGFIWVGSQGGLFRYDGYEYVRFVRRSDRPAESLSDNYISALAEGGDGSLWVGAWRGLSRRRPGAREFEPMHVGLAIGGSLDATAIHDLLVQGEELLLATDVGLFRWRPGEAVASQLVGGIVTAVAAAQDGGWWVGRRDGLIRLDSEGRRRATPPLDAPESARIVFNLLTDESGDLWVCFQQGLYVLRAGAQSWKPPPKLPTEIASGRCNALLKDAENSIWIGHALRGLIRYWPKTGRHRVFAHSLGDPYTLSNNHVSTLLRDRTGSLWVGTFNNGLNRADVTAGGFERLTADWIEGMPPTGRVFALAGDDKELWVGSADFGLIRIELASSRAEHFRHDARNPRTLADDRVNFVAYDRNGAVWVSTGNALHRYEGEGRFRRYPQPGTPTGDAGLLIDQRNRFWVWKRREGLYEVDPSNPGTIVRHHFRPADETGDVRGDDLIYVNEDGRGRLWLAANLAGAVIFDPGRGRVRALRREENDPNSLSDDRAVAFLHARDGTSWVGTGAGLNHVRLADDLDGDPVEIRRYTVTDGLASDTIGCMQEDDAGRIWFSTIDGLSVLNPADGAVQNYSERDGALRSYFIFRCARLPDGRMAFGGPDGATIFHPRDIRPNPLPPNAQITEFRVNHRELPDDDARRRHLAAGREIALDHRENRFAFEFSAMHYGDVRRNRFRYRLQGYDEEWQEIDATRRVAAYTNLPPGRYRFDLLAANSSGVWQETPTSISLRLTAAPWASPLAYAAYVAAALGLLAAIYVRRRSALQLERAHHADIQRLNTELEARVESRTRELERANRELAESNRELEGFSYSVSHDLRAPLRSVRGFSAALREEYGAALSPDARGYVERVERGARQMSELIDDLLRFAQLSRTALKIEEVDVEALVRECWSGLTEGDREAPTLRVEKLPPGCADRALLRQVLMNLLGNAIKYTRRTVDPRVEISASLHETDCVYVVTDNGAGFDMSNADRLFGVFQRLHAQDEYEGTGIGLALCRRIIERHGGRIWAEGQVGVGAAFFFSLPRPRE